MLEQDATKQHLDRKLVPLPVIKEKGSIEVLNNIGWEDAGRLDLLLSQIDSDIARILDRAIKGDEIGFEEGLALARASGPEMEALVLVADWLRQQCVGDVITYIVNRNINFTNICFVGCRFCAF